MQFPRVLWLWQDILSLLNCYYICLSLLFLFATIDRLNTEFICVIPASLTSSTDVSTALLPSFSIVVYLLQREKTSVVQHQRGNGRKFQKPTSCVEFERISAHTHTHSNTDTHVHTIYIYICIYICKSNTIYLDIWTSNLVILSHISTQSITEMICYNMSIWHIFRFHVL